MALSIDDVAELALASSNIADAADPEDSDASSDDGFCSGPVSAAFRMQQGSTKKSAARKGVTGGGGANAGGGGGGGGGKAVVALQSVTPLRPRKVCV